MNTLYYGDNLDILRRYVKDESVDLVYLDPPFNSSATYNVLFGGKGGAKSAAQIKAFDDTWHWDEVAGRAYFETVQAGGGAGDALRAFRSLIGEGDMLAYLAMMAPRLVELRRVLKPTGSIYLHCDPTASHYLKVLMDAVFGPEHFRNEIIWKRTSAHSGSKKFGPIHDVLLYYAKGSECVWNPLHTGYDDAYLDKYYRFDDGDGRLYWRADLCAAGTRKGRSGQPWRGIDPTTKGMHWKFTVEKLDELDAEGRIYWPPRGTMPQYKRYRDELKGKNVPDIWDDIDRINPVGAERLGYPTQKPLALLERIIQASSNPGDLVLDPFCGCGTTVAAAQKLDRQWIGVDITHLAIALMRQRLKDMFGDAAKFRVIGEPTTEEDAAAFGLTFASQLELRRYLVLRSDAERGGLAELELQPAFDITPPGQRRRRYTADFRYLDLTYDPPVYVVEEVKPRQKRAWSRRGAWRLRLDLAASRYPTHQGKAQRFVVVEL